MDVKYLNSYIQYCEFKGINPTFKGLKKFKEFICTSY